MYRVVLVDDEEIIVKGLQQVVDWKSLGCEVVATAFDAASGAAAIRAHKPDILITDIKMPDQNGLNMVAGLKSEFPDMQVTILTGYRNFEYAQQAIRLGVSRLLLKPSHMGELIEALQAMIAALKSQEQDEAAPDVPQQSAPDEQANSFIVRQALAQIESRYFEKLTLQELADSCYVSQWHLSKLLNRHTGKSFYDLLNAARVREAKTLLNDPKLKINDICDMVGYTDTGHFSRVFKKLTGMSPNAYRNQLRAPE